MSLLVYVLGREVAAHCLQAVRIPLEFEMKGSEVLIRQEGDSLILTPIRRNRLRAQGSPGRVGAAGRSRPGGGRPAPASSGRVLMP